MDLFSDAPVTDFGVIDDGTWKNKEGLLKIELLLAKAEVAIMKRDQMARIELEVTL